MIKLIKFTIIFTIVGIVAVIAFDLGYLMTMFVTANREYSLNMGIFANILMLLGLLADSINNISQRNKQTPIESDLTPKGFKQAAMPEDAANQIDPNKRQVVLNNGYDNPDDLTWVNPEHSTDFEKPMSINDR